MAEFKTLKFVMNEPVEVELAFDEPRKMYSEKFGTTSYAYGIKPLISGENIFNATEKLHETIQGLGPEKGTKITICKVNNGKFTYFDVSGSHVIKEDTSTNVAATNWEEKNGEKSIMMSDVKTDVPINVRHSELAKKVAVIQQDVEVLKKWVYAEMEKGRGNDQEIDPDKVPF